MAELTDTEIRSILKKHGEDIGPITASTRSTYSKKVERIKKLDKSSIGKSDSSQTKDSPSFSQSTSSKSTKSTGQINSKTTYSQSTNSDKGNTKSSPLVIKHFSTPKITNYPNPGSAHSPKPSESTFNDPMLSGNSFGREEHVSNISSFGQHADFDIRRRLDRNSSPIHYSENVAKQKYNPPLYMKYSSPNAGRRPVPSTSNRSSLLSFRTVSSSGVGGSGEDFSAFVDGEGRSYPSYQPKNQHQPRYNTEKVHDVEMEENESNFGSRIRKWYTGSLGTVSKYFPSSFRQTNHSNGGFPGNNSYHYDNDLVMDISDGDLSETDDSNLIARLKKNYTKKRPSPLPDKSRSLLGSSQSEGKTRMSCPFNINQLPNVLLLAFISFAVVLFSCYLFRKSQLSYTELDMTIEGLVCKSPSTTPGEDGGALSRHCFSSSDMVKLRMHLATLYTVLSEYSGDKMCHFVQDRRVSFSKAREILNFRLKREQSRKRSTQDLSDGDWNRLMQLLILLPHDQLQIMAYTKDGRPVEHNRLPEHITYLEGMAPKRSIMCRLKMAAVSMFNFVTYVACVVAVLTVLLFVGYCLNLYRLKKKQIHDIRARELQEIVSSISVLLQDQLRQSDYSPSSDPFLSLVKIRSIIQSAYPKVKDDKFWDQVKQFMYKSEPLIELKESIVHGETLQWKCRAGWQGSAVQSECQVKFEKGPTECLKIHNMELHQFDETGQNYLRRELLTRLKDVGEVRDLRFLIKGSKVIVYIMCASREVAGKAFRKINANYFNGNLISVKFIRLDKYLERFPDSKVYVY